MDTKKTFNVKYKTVSWANSGGKLSTTECKVKAISTGQVVEIITKRTGGKAFNMVILEVDDGKGCKTKTA